MFEERCTEPLGIGLKRRSTEMKKIDLNGAVRLSRNKILPREPNR